MASSGHGQLQLCKDGVFIHVSTTDTDEDILLPGQVCIWKKTEGVFLEWKPSSDIESVSAGAKDTEWTMVHPETSVVSFTAESNAQHNNVVSYRPKAAGMTSQATKYVVNFDIKDLRTFHRSKPSTGWSYLVFILKCGTTFPALHFHHGGIKDVIQELRKHLHIKTSPQDPCLYLVFDHDPQALHKSFDELQLFEGEQAGDIISKFMQDPYSATMGGFSKVTHFLRDTLLATDRPEEVLRQLSSDVVSTNIPELAVNSLSEAGFELVTTRELPPLPQVVRSMPVNSELWSSYMNSEGCITDAEDVKDAIFRGGVDPFIRTEVWKFLLGYYEWNSTYKTRSEQRKQKVDDYFRMKLQWKSITADQESRFSELRDRRSLIEKDVARTDRTHSFFQGENNANINVLYDILLTHCMYNFDLGYVQGMSDLLAPILVVMENEVDAFWCFAGFMHMTSRNFEKDQQAMKTQLQQLQLLLNFIDPELANYLESQESSNMYFCFRWLLILFKREFSFPDIMRLWEVLWTGRPCKNFHLLLCLSVLINEKTTLIESNFGFTEILKHINDMSGSLLVDDMLMLAEALYLQLRSCRDLPTEIHDILAVTSPLSLTCSTSNCNVVDYNSQQLHTPNNYNNYNNNNNRSVQHAATSCSGTTIVNNSRPAVSGTSVSGTGVMAGTQVGTTTTDSIETSPADDSSIEILSESV